MPSCGGHKDTLEFKKKLKRGEEERHRGGERGVTQNKGGMKKCRAGRDRETHNWGDGGGGGWRNS